MGRGFSRSGFFPEIPAYKGKISIHEGVYKSARDRVFLLVFSSLAVVCGFSYPHTTFSLLRVLLFLFLFSCRSISFR
jgi:ABC-type microcin C transport system permease subunit YejB